MLLNTAPFPYASKITMPTLLNTQTGEVFICDSAPLAGGLTVEEISSYKLQFRHKFHAGRGWIIQTIEPCFQSGHDLYYKLLFHDGRLISVSFSMIDDENIDPKLLQSQHVHFLRNEIGPPAAVEKNGLIALWQYFWGGVTAAYDPRNDSSGITVRWKSATDQNGS